MAGHNTNDLKILYWNSQSLYHKSIEVFDYFINNHIDIGLFTETWLKPKQKLSHHKYEIYRADRTDAERGGVAIAIRKDIRHTLLPSINLKIIESIAIEVSTNQGDITFAAAYYPGTKNSATDLPQFHNDIVSISNTRKSYFVCGDFNAKHRHWNCSRGNSAGTILFNEMSQKNFNIYHPPSPTNFPRQANHTPSTIDLVLSNGLHNTSQMFTQQVFASDHLPTTFTVECSYDATTTRICKDNYNAANWYQFRANINAKINLSNFRINTISEIDQAIENFYNIMTESKINAIPTISTIQSNQYVLPDPIKHLISLRNAKRRQWQRLRDFNSLFEYKTLKKEIDTRIFELKNSNWNNYLSKLAPHSKNFWAVAKSLKTKTSKIPPLKTVRGILFTDEEKAEEIAETFHKNHTLTLNKIHRPTELAVENSMFTLNNDISQDPIQLTSPKEIKNILKSLQNKTSSSVDKITNKLLKNLPKKAHIYLCQLFNACMKLNYFPEVWKHAKVVAIPKPKKNPADASSYRPISLLSSLSKILEKILLQRLNKHIKDFNCIPNFQFGFREQHSTNHQLVRVVNYVRNGLKHKRSTGMVVLDIQKAFDCVWHNGLLHKMLNIKVPMYIIKAIQSFLSNRSFQVHINNSNSSSKTIPAGVPQGSCLSPTLYNIYTSDVPTLDNCEIAMYADDSAVLCSSECPLKITHNLETALDKLTAHYNKWKIQINPSKTQATYFTNRRAQRYLPQRNLRHNNSELEWKSDTKYLGVNLDKKLKFTIHIDQTVKKSHQIIRTLYPLINRKSKLNLNNKLLLYKSVFRPVITYGCPTWGNCAQTHLKRIQIVQNKVLKLMLNLPFFHSTVALHEEAKMKMISQYINDLKNKFFARCTFSEYELIANLHEM